MVAALCRFRKNMALRLAKDHYATWLPVIICRCILFCPMTCDAESAQNVACRLSVLHCLPTAHTRRHLSQASRVAYASVALQHYKALFDDGLEGLLRALGPDAAPSMPALLRIREQLLAGGRLP